MIASGQKKIFYKALLAKDTEYEGVFFVGVKTTGVFCRPSCPARKPKFEHCEFFNCAKEALLASYRPCLRCQPLSHPSQMSPVVRKLVQAVEACPQKRWRDQDFRALSIDASTARRQFKKRFGMTFVAYARSRRMGLAMADIRRGRQVIDAQLTAGYESGSGFRDAFSKIMGAAPALANGLVLRAAWLDSPLGPMIAIADEKALYLLEFVDRRGLEREVEQIRKKCKAAIIPGKTLIIKMIKDELSHYFSGKCFIFKTPIYQMGTPFQKRVWDKLRQIEPGQTRSYLDLAKALHQRTACRAVARANAANPLALIVPCHRVINSSGEVGGYGGGEARKRWLLQHEKNKYKKNNKS